MSVTSNGKGGTGKTTISTILTLGLNIAGISTLLIDTSSEGGSSSLLLGQPPPPFLRDVLSGKASLIESIGVYRLALEGQNIEFFMLPNRGPLPDISNIDRLFNNLDRLRDVFNIIFFDLPAFQGNGIYSDFIEHSNIVLKVVEPNIVAINAVLQLKTQAREIYVLNCPRPYPSKVISRYKKLLEERVGEENVIHVEYDYAASRLSHENLNKVLSHLSDSFQSSLYLIAKNILKPKLKEGVVL